MGFRCLYSSISRAAKRFRQQNGFGKPEIGYFTLKAMPKAGDLDKERKTREFRQWTRWLDLSQDLVQAKSLKIKALDQVDQVDVLFST